MNGISLRVDNRYDSAQVIERVNLQFPDKPVRRCNECVHDIKSSILFAIRCPLFGCSRTNAELRCPMFEALPSAYGAAR